MTFSRTFVRAFAPCFVLASLSLTVTAQPHHGDTRDFGSTFASLEYEAVRVVTEYDDLVLTAHRNGSGGITAFYTQDGRRNASLSVSPNGQLHARIAGSRHERPILIGTASGVQGKTAAWANDQLFLLLSQSKGIENPSSTILVPDGVGFYSVPGQRSVSAGKSAARPEWSQKIVTTHFPEYIAKSVTHPHLAGRDNIQGLL